MLVTGESFGKLFRTFEHTAFRLETRESYNEEVEQDPLRRFLAGEPDDLEWRREWLTMIARSTAEGKRFTRVRIASVPLSDYNRFGLHCAKDTNEAGEDIRYLDRANAEGLPDFDYWLFDSRQVARMHFGQDGRFQGAEIITEPSTVVELSAARDDAWHRAVSRDQFEIHAMKEGNVE